MPPLALPETNPTCTVYAECEYKRSLVQKTVRVSVMCLSVTHLTDDLS